MKVSAQQWEGAAQGLKEVKDAVLSWEQQAQGALQQLESLKDILEESAAWSGAPPFPWTCFMLRFTPPRGGKAFVRILVCGN